MRTYKQLMEMNRGHSSFEQPDDPEFELQVYKKEQILHRRGNWDDDLKNKSELMSKLKKYGVVKRPIFGKIS